MSTALFFVVGEDTNRDIYDLRVVVFSLETGEYLDITKETHSNLVIATIQNIVDKRQMPGVDLNKGNITLDLSGHPNYRNILNLFHEAVLYSCVPSNYGVGVTLLIDKDSVDEQKGYNVSKTIGTQELSQGWVQNLREQGYLYGYS